MRKTSDQTIAWPFRHPLAREVAVALTLNAVALGALYVAFFGAWQRPDVTPETVETALFEATRADSARSAGDD